MKTFLQFIAEAGGSKAGDIEVAKTNISDAIEHAIEILGQEKFDEIPNFISNFKRAQSAAKLGWTKRKDMPVISSNDVQDLKNRLEKGFLDVMKPFAVKGGFPEKLSGKAAEQWLKNGLPEFDGHSSDDRVSVEYRRVTVGDLKPIQKQIYLDKSLGGLAKGTLESTISFLQNQTIYIVSSDNYIIDGHHRYMSAMLLDPNMKVQTLSINLPIKTLLPLTLAYGDAIGNKRNK